MDINLRFSILTNEQVSASDIEINKSKQSSEIGTIKDRRLGEVNNVECETCKLTKNTGCNGHSGKIPLGNRIFIQPSMVNEIKNVLNMFCYGCKMLKNQSKINDIIESNKTKKHIKDFRELKNATKCENQFCNEKFGNYKFKDSKFYVKKDNIDMECDNIVLYSMLKSIENISYDVFSIKYPSDVFIHRYMLAPTNTIRQPYLFDGQETNIITNKYNKIIGDIISKKDVNIQQSINDLDNDKSIKPYKKTNVKTVTISDLASEYFKKGLLRSHVLSLRGGNNARCVVSQGIDLNIGEVSVPEKILNVLTDPIYYSRFSESHVKDTIYNNDFVYLIKEKTVNDCKRYQLFSFMKDKVLEKFAIQLKYGDFIEVQKQEGSYIIRVRQPTLYKYNITADKVIKNNNSEDTLRTNTSSITVRGEDYDGDEESSFNPHSKSSQFEQSVTMSSRSMIKNNSLGVLVYGLIQDQIIALHLLSKMENINLSECVLLLGKYSCLIRDIKKTKYTGKELISLFFPEHIYVSGLIENGLLIRDITSKELTSSSSESIANHLSQLVNNEFSLNIIDSFSYLSQRYLSYYGFSVTPKDVFLNNIEINDIQSKIQNWVNLYTDMINNYLNDVKKNKTEILPQALFEKIIFTNLNSIQRLTMNQIRILFSNVKNNSVLTMEEANFKINRGELLTNYGMLGQQGKAKSQHRMMGRCISQQLPKTLCPESFGYITTGLLYGLSPDDYFIQIKDTSLPNISKITVKTAATGHIGRQVVKFLESLVVNDYLGVDSYDENILPAANHLKISGGDICKVVILKPTDFNFLWTVDITYTYDSFKKFLLFDNNTSIVQKLDFFIDIDNEIRSFKSHNKLITDGLEKINLFVRNLIKYYFFYNVDDTWFKYCLITYLDPNRLKSIGIKLTDDLLDYIFSKINSRLETSLSPGTPIGIEYGCNLQENFTQQSLSSFHTTDKRGQQIKKLGFTEFKKLVDLVKNKYQTIMLITKHKSKLKLIKSQIEFICLGDLNPKINIVSIQDKFLQLEIIVSKSILEIKHVSVYQLYCMITRFLEYKIMFENPNLSISLDKNNSCVKLEISVDLFEPYERKLDYLILSLNDGIYKGKLFNSDLSINSINIYNDNLELESNYELKIILDDIKILKDFDTREVVVATNDILTICDMKGIQLAEYDLNTMILDTFGDKTYSLYNSVNLLSRLMCKDSKITNIKKLKDTNCIIKSAISGIGNAFSNASLRYKLDKCQDTYSRIFTGIQNNKGTKYHKFFIDPNRYDILTTKKDTKKKISKGLKSLHFTSSL